jgi:hypothetical protein
VLIQLEAADSLEPEWGVSLKDIIHEALQHRDEAGQPE